MLPPPLALLIITAITECTQEERVSIQVQGVVPLEGGGALLYKSDRVHN